MNSNQNGGRRLDGYVRVSDVHGREGDSFIAPDQQREKISAWAALNDHEIATWEEDFDQSGGKLKRPGLDRIMARIRAGETDGIAIARLDRFSRAGVGDALALIEEITQTHGAVFGCVQPQIDTSDPVMGEFVLTIFLGLARMERQRIRANWGEAKARAVGRGIHVSANVPFGYVRPLGDANPRTGRRPTLPLQPDPETAWMVPELFRRRAAGESWETIRRWLVDNDAPTVRGQPWATSTLMGMVKNRVYLGEARGAGGDHVAVDAHPALVDEPTWHAAQGRRSPMRRDVKESPSLLRGLVRCGGCRYVMQSRAAAQTNGPGAYIFVCSSRVGCPNPALVTAIGVHGRLALDDTVVGLVREWEREREERIVFEGFDPTLDVDADRADLEQLVAARERDRLDEELQAALGRPEWLKHLADLTGRINDKQAEIEEKLRQLGGPGRPGAEFWEKWESGETSVEEKRAYLGGVIQAVFVNPDGARGAPKLDAELRRRWFANRVQVVWADEPPLVDIPRQGLGGYRIKPWPFSDASGSDPDVLGVVPLQPEVEDPGEAVG